MGVFQETASFNPTNPASDQRTSQGENDVYLVQYSSAGALNYVRAIQSTQSIVVKGIDLDANDNVYFTGQFRNDVTLEGASSKLSGFSGDNQPDIYLAKYNRSGSHQFSRALVGDGYDEPRNLNVFGSGLYIAGLFQGSLSFGGGNTIDSEKKIEAFLAKFNLNGELDFAEAFTGKGENRADAISNVPTATYLAGTLEDEIKLNPSSTEVTKNPSSRASIYFAKYENANAFPQITSVAEAEGKVKIVGSNFTNNPDLITVELSDSDNPGVEVTGVTVNNAGTEILATVNTLYAGTYNVKVTVSGVSTEGELTVTPRINEVTPASTLLTISGSFLKGETIVTEVLVFDGEGSPITTSGITVNEGGTEVTATVGALEKGEYSVIVRIGSLESNSASFSWNPEEPPTPAITAASISEGTLTVTGTNLGSDELPPTVTLTYEGTTNVSLTDIKYNADGTQITASVGIEEPGKYNVSVTVNEAPANFEFTINENAPDGPDITDAVIVDGVITITGVRLGSDAFPPSVTLTYEVTTSITLSNIQYNEDGTEITADVASAEAGGYQVSVTVNGQFDDFTFSIVPEGEPAITEVNYQQNQLTISGTNFGSDNTVVGVRILLDGNAVAEFTNPTLNEAGTEIQVSPEEPLAPGNYIVEVSIDGELVTEPFTVQDNPPQVTVAFSPATFEVGSESMDVNITVNDDQPGTTATLSFLGIRKDPGATSWIEKPDITFTESSQTLLVTLNASDFDELGLQFWVEATDADGNNVIKSVEYIYLDYPTTQPLTIPRLQPAGDSPSSQDYQLIALPLQVGNIATAMEEFGEQDAKKWRMFRLREGNYQEYKRSFNENSIWSGDTRLGEGYMLIHKNPTDVSIEGSVAQSSIDNPVTITLQPGANFIGNPYPFSVNWSDVLAANPAVRGIRKFSNGNYASESTSASLATFEGALIFNDNADEQSIEIKIPVGTSLSNGSRSEKNNANGTFSSDLASANWKMPLQLSVAGSQTTSYGGFGMHEQAQPSADRMDDYTPPRLSDYVEINFTHPEFFLSDFAVDIVPTATEHIWPLEVSTSFKGKTHTLVWETMVPSAQGSQLFLVDNTSGQVVDMEKKTSYSFTAGDTHSLEILWGSEEMLAQHLGDAYVSIGSPYPNPVERALRIPVYASSEETIVVRMFDAMGQLVALKEYSLSMGTHELEWEMKQTGQKNGMYLYEVSTPGKLLSRGKIIVQ